MLDFVTSLLLCRSLMQLTTVSLSSHSESSLAFIISYALSTHPPLCSEVDMHIFHLWLKLRFQLFRNNRQSSKAHLSSVGGIQTLKTVGGPSSPIQNNINPLINRVTILHLHNNCYNLLPIVDQEQRKARGQRDVSLMRLKP